MHRKYAGIGVSLGVCFGAVLGAAMHNVGMWVALGICFGAAFGAALARTKGEDSN